MFDPKKSDNGHTLPWEHLPAAAGNYVVGQVLNMTSGKLTAVSSALTTTPTYLCMAQKTCAAGDELPVTRISKNYIYETTLSAEASTATVGTKMQVAAGGLQVNAAATGTFEVVSMEGTAAGDCVRGRWV